MDTERRRGRPRTGAWCQPLSNWQVDEVEGAVL